MNVPYPRPRSFDSCATDHCSQAHRGKIERNLGPGHFGTALRSRNIVGTWLSIILVGISLLWVGCSSPTENEEEPSDGISQLPIELTGSLQNPAWSPDGNELLFTRFESGYNREPADLLVYNLETNALRLLVSDGSGNINLPGAVWNSMTEQIVFSSTRDPHDEIFIINGDGIPGEEWRVTSRENFVAYEPSFSPDGQWVVFESHQLDVEENGVIMKYRINGSEDYVALTSLTDDCRQPNWSPRGDCIVYQRFSNGQWDLWVVNVDASNAHQITSGTGDKTDASFSPDGEWIVYSSDESGLEFASIFIIPVSGGASVRVTEYSGYGGAPSWSQDGATIAFEACPSDPDYSTGTTLWLVDAPRH